MIEQSNSNHCVRRVDDRPVKSVDVDEVCNSYFLIVCHVIIERWLHSGWKLIDIDEKNHSPHSRLIEISFLRFLPVSSPKGGGGGARGKEERVGWKKHNCGSGDSKLAYGRLHTANSKPFKNALVTHRSDPICGVMREYHVCLSTDRGFPWKTEDKSHNSPLRNDGYGVAGEYDGVMIEQFNITNKREMRLFRSKRNWVNLVFCSCNF